MVRRHQRTDGKFRVKAAGEQPERDNAACGTLRTSAPGKLIAINTGDCKANGCFEVNLKDKQATFHTHTCTLCNCLVPT